MKHGSMRINIHGVEEVLKEMESIENKGKKVVERSLGDFKKRAPSWISQAVVKEYNISKSDITGKRKDKDGKEIVKIRVHGDGIKNTYISYTGRTITAAHFSKNMKTIPDLENRYVRLPYGSGYRMVQLRKPVNATVTIKKGEKKKLKGDHDTPIFIAKTSRTKDNYLPFQRTGKKVEKSGLDEMRTIKTLSVPQMIENEEVSKDIRNRINEGMSKRIDHHMKHIMGRK